MNNHYVQSIVSLILGIMLVVLGVTIFWLVFPYKTVKFNKVPFKVFTPVVKVGENLVYEVDNCKYSKVTPATSKSLVNNIIYNLPVGIAMSKPKGCGVYKFNLTIPMTLPPDIYHLQTTYSYQVNPVRTISITTITEDFKVIK